MRINVFLTKPTKTLPRSTQEFMNTYIHKCLGHNNKYHDAFSDYSISSLQGGVWRDGVRLFENEEPYFVISSENTEFISDILLGIQSTDIDVMSMRFARFEIDDFHLHTKFDKVLSISPILLKDKNDKKITYLEDGWLERLTEQSIGKLKHCGIEDTSLKIEFFHKEKAKPRMVYVGKTFNPCSMVGLKISGTERARRALYNLGLGNCTGCGFGAVKTYA